MATCMPQCTVWFYNPQNDSGLTSANLINKFVASVSPPFCHVELQFPSGEACSIVMHGTVRMRQRTFDPEFYADVVLHAQPQALAKTLALARWHVDSRTPFGVSSGHTFCSKLVAELLRDGGIVPPHALPQATVISPSALHEHLVRFRDTPLLRDPHAVVSAPTPPVDFAPQRCAPQLRLTGP